MTVLRSAAAVSGVGFLMMAVVPNLLAFVAGLAPIEDDYTRDWIEEVASPELKTATVSLTGPSLDDRTPVTYDATLRYLDAGDGDEVLVMFPPAGFSLDYFKKVIPVLSRDHRVIAVDLPGHGYSSMPPSVLNEQVLSDAAVALIEELDLHGVTTIGESSGATVSLMAAMRSDRVERVIALDPYDHAENLEGDSGVQGTLIGKMNFAMMDLFGPTALYSAGAPGSGPWMMHQLLQAGTVDPENLPYDLIQELVKQSRQAGYRRPQFSLFQERDWFDVPARYPDMPEDVAVTVSYADTDWSEEGSRNTVRQLLVGDCADAGQPTECTEFALGNDRAVLVEDSGHFSALDQPGQVLEIIAEALRSPVMEPTDVEPTSSANFID